MFHNIESIMSNVSGIENVFSCNNHVFTVSHQNSVLKLERITVSVSILMSLPYEGVLSLVSHFKKELCSGGVYCHLLFGDSNKGSNGAAERETEPPVQSNSGLCGQREYKLQDRTKSEEIDLLDPFLEWEAAYFLSSFPKGLDLWSTLNKQNTVWT